MEKARQQKAQAAPKNVDVTSPDVQAEMAAIDARRRAAEHPTEAPPPPPAGQA